MDQIGMPVTCPKCGADAESKTFQQRVLQEHRHFQGVVRTWERVETIACPNCGTFTHTTRQTVDMPA